MGPGKAVPECCQVSGEERFGTLVLKGFYNVGMFVIKVASVSWFLGLFIYESGLEWTLLLWWIVELLDSGGSAVFVCAVLDFLWVLMDDSYESEGFWSHVDP